MNGQKRSLASALDHVRIAPHSQGRGSRRVPKLRRPVSDAAQMLCLSYLMANSLTGLEEWNRIASMNLPLKFLLMMWAGWVNRAQQNAIDYLKEESRILREQVGR